MTDQKTRQLKMHFSVCRFPVLQFTVLCRCSSPSFSNFVIFGAPFFSPAFLALFVVTSPADYGCAATGIRKFSLYRFLNILLVLA